MPWTQVDDHQGITHKGPERDTWIGEIRAAGGGGGGGE